MMKEMLKGMKHRPPMKPAKPSAEESFDEAMDESADDMYDSGEQGLAEEGDMHGGDDEADMESPLAAVDDEDLLAEIKKRGLKA